MKRPESLSPARRSSARRRTCRVWSGAGRTVPVPFDDATLRIAVREWLQDPTAAEVQYGHISDWDTSRVRDMSNLFSGAVDFNQPLRWNTRNVDNMESMFVQASSFNQPLELDTSRVRNMCNLFARAVNFDQPLVRWDTGNVRDMSFMFQGADAFNRPLQLDTHRVVDMESMFDGAIAFNQPLQWETSEVVNMAGMFSDARSFNQPLQWDTRNVRTMTWMFSDAVALNQSLQLDTQNVEDMACVFRGATTFDQPLQWNTCNVRSMTGMFIGAKAFNQPLPWDTRNVEDMSEMFAGAIAFDQPLSHWITSNVQTTAGMFIGASRFNQPLSNWDTRNVTTMAGMFIGASRFNQSLSSWDTRNVTTMRTIFDKAPLMLGRYPDGKIRRPIDRWTQVRDHYTPERRRPRWHWQESCDVGSDVPLDVLRGWAGEFGIPLHHPTTQRPKTKRAFCADLARWWDAQRDAQRTMSPSCHNETNLWTGVAVDDIPSEFFYHYQHGDRVYCDDIRSLHKHVNSYRSLKNPYNAMPYSPELVEDINASYDRLRRRAVHLDDFVDRDDPANVPLPFHARVSQKLADLMSRLYHPVGPERLRGASADVWDGFLAELVEAQVLSLPERALVNAQPDLDQQKYFLVELLVRKIDHDPRQIPTQHGPLSQIAYLATEVYNRIFG